MRLSGASLNSVFPAIALDQSVPTPCRPRYGTRYSIRLQGMALPFAHKSRHSESPGGHPAYAGLRMQGAIFAAMVVPLQENATKQMAAGRLARREPSHTSHTCVAALANGATIGCAPRLGLTHV